MKSKKILISADRLVSFGKDQLKLGEALWDLSLVSSDWQVGFRYIPHYGLFDEDKMWIYQLHNSKSLDWEGTLEEDEIRLHVHKDYSFSRESFLFEKRQRGSGDLLYWRFKRLHQNQWDLSRVCCPFCKTITHGIFSECSHILIAGASLIKRASNWRVLFNRTCDQARTGHPALEVHNLQMDGVVSKFDRRPVGRDIIYQSTIYVRDEDAEYALARHFSQILGEPPPAR